MRRRPASGRSWRRGVAALLSIQFLALFAAVGVAFAAFANLEVQKADNLRAVTEARLAAESGLSLMLEVIRTVRLPVETERSTLLENLYASLSDKLAGLPQAGLSPNSGASAVALDVTNSAIRLTDIQLAHGGFSCAITPVPGASSPTCRLTITGTSGEACHRVAIDLVLGIKRSTVFNYGVASRGMVCVKGGKLTGVNSPSEATVLSTRSETPAIVVEGSGSVGGELYVTGRSRDYVEVGNTSVAGCNDPEVILSQHVNYGVEDPIFPDIDARPFVAMAVNEVNAATPLPADLQLNNVRIASGTNPNFQNVVINGVFYVEAPNVVKFSGNVVIKGIIVTEQDPWQAPSGCQIDFRGGVEAPGVEALPEGDPRFAEIKKYSGTVILAPGFGISFLGSAETMNGVIAADRLYFSGNASILGGFCGPILGLTDSAMVFGGSSEVRLCGLADDDLLPAGFTHVKGLTPVAGSYAEPGAGPQTYAGDPTEIYDEPLAGAGEPAPAGPLL